MRLNFNSLQFDVFHFFVCLFLCWVYKHMLAEIVFDFSLALHTALKHSISTMPFNLLLHRLADAMVFLLRSFISLFVFAILYRNSVTSRYFHSVFFLWLVHLHFVVVVVVRFKFQ